MWGRLVERANDMMVFAVCALVFGIAKTVVSPGQRGLRNYLTTIFVSVPVGTLAGMMALEQPLGDSTCIAIASVASVLADKIVISILAREGLIGRALDNLVDKFTK